jgi:hypothetical protein
MLYLKDVERSFLVELSEFGVVSECVTEIESHVEKKGKLRKAYSFLYGLISFP